MKIVHDHDDGGDVRAPSHVQFSHRLSEVPTLTGLPEIEVLKNELLGYMNELLGRTDPPIDSPYLNLMEVATAYYARGQEIDMLIHAGELEGLILKGTEYYRFRTGVLRSFIDAARKMADLGSRRLTQEELLSKQRYDGGGGLR